jgi:hypothetical protein
MAGAAATLTATVSPSSATGTVTFMDGANALGTVVVTRGTATLAVPALAAGTHALTAVYNTDATFTASTSAPVNWIVVASQGPGTGGTV